MASSQDGVPMILPVAQPKKWHYVEWLCMRFKGFDPLVDLEWRFKQEPGMAEKEWVLVSQGITSWAQLGRLSGRRWMATSAAVPQKRLSDIHIDMKDPKRLGPGHMQNLDKFWSQAFKDL